MNASDKRHLKRLLHSKADIRASLQSFLAQHTKRSLKKPIQREREAAEKKERLIKKEETASIRGAVFARAGNRCEARHRAERPGLPDYFWRCPNDAMIWDHWLGGNGRRRQKQSVETTWALCFTCNDARTNSAPSAVYWNESHESHCRRHGYPFVPHIEHAEVSR